ncbi:UNVERIFIED_CONTAM: hypothetical protein K2H54_076877 [Gekko kuhli]
MQGAGQAASPWKQRQPLALGVLRGNRGPTIRQPHASMQMNFISFFRLFAQSSGLGRRRGPQMYPELEDGQQRQERGEQRACGGED